MAQQEPAATGKGIIVFRPLIHSKFTNIEPLSMAPVIGQVLFKVGKKWVDRTMSGLQERMEKAYKDGTLGEMDPEAFKDFATDIHSEVYNKEGFADISMDDKIKVISALAKKGALWEVNTWLEAIELGNKIYKERVGPIPYWE